jgi:hypothetical protein
MESLNVPFDSAANSPRIIQSIVLPHSKEIKPGRLHTIATDAEGNIYYSDEFNHGVVSLNGNGSLRWQNAKQGTAAGEFWYPRGLAIGCLQIQGETISCLAVADAWNRRVQFLDVNGDPLTMWTHGGDKAFGEVADIRFIRENEDSNSEAAGAGFWYVLDRGNHRICKIGMRGEMVDQIGSCFPMSLEKNWAAPRVFFGKAAGSLNSFAGYAPFDFTYYPDRILGRSVDSLFICERNSRRLKQVIPPHIFPLHIDLEGDVEWIAADSSALLGWKESENRFVRPSSADGKCDQTVIMGRPVQSNKPSDEFWVQSEEGIKMWKWPASTGRQESKRLQPCPWINQAAEKQLDLLDQAAIRKSVETCLAKVDEEVKVAVYIFAIRKIEPTQELVEWMPRHAPEFACTCALATQDLCEALHHWCLSQLGQQIAGTSGKKPHKESSDLERMVEDLAKQIDIRMADIKKGIDDLCRTLSSQIPTSGNSPSMHDAWDKVALISRSNLEYAKEWITQWSGITAANPDEKSM